ncbi:MAG: Nramp family divalent metal transporter [Planctomycetaceae bacterium]
MSEPGTRHTDGLGTQPPQSFMEYMRSFGPGIVVVLTWLGAGDIVDMAVAGGNYGYSLMWVLVVSVVVRYLFVSLIARYQLCNQHNESVLDGLTRVHPCYAPMLFGAAVVMSHVYASYMTVGIGEACANMVGHGQTWQWAVLWNVVALLLVFRPAYRRVETLFKILLAVLTLCFLGTAIGVGPNMRGVLQGLYRVSLPDQSGNYNAVLVATAMIGAVGGSLGNLLYPYFLENKGWRGRQFLRVQRYDFLLAIVAMIVLNLSIWTLGAELLYPRKLTIDGMDDLPRLLSEVIGPAGRTVFYVGIFAAVFTSLIGHAMGLALLGSHAFLRWRTGRIVQSKDFQSHPVYRWIVVWCLLSPLVWTLPGMPDFVTLTLVSNSLQVVLIPIIAGGLWYITASPHCIGASDINRWWENLLMGCLFLLGLYGSYASIALML